MTMSNNEYVIDNKILSKIDTIRQKFPANENKSSIIESLLILQHENNGYVTKNIISALSKYLHVNEIDIYEVATFYSMINTKVVGKNTISVCNNVSCMLKGSDKIILHLENKLGIKRGNSTKDNIFFLKDEIECLAACNGAPMMQINHKNYENLTIEKVDKILKDFK